MAKVEEELKEKIQKYRNLTVEALEKIKLKEKLSENELKIAKDFLEMARNYFNDADHFEQKGELLTALAAFSYAHAWLDAGVRAGLFDAGNDDKHFTLPLKV